MYIALQIEYQFEYARKWIVEGKYVICEKPCTLTKSELIGLKDLAAERGVIIIEAITNLYLSNYDVLKQSISEIGNCKIAQFNYSQYSSRYDDFKKGKIQPAFETKYSWGVIMNIHV